MAGSDDVHLVGADSEPLRQALVRLQEGYGEEIVELGPVDPVKVEKKGLFGKAKLVDASLFVQCVWYGTPDGSGGFMASVGYPPGPPLSGRVVPFPAGAAIRNESETDALVELADELSPAAAAQVVLYIANLVIAPFCPRGLRLTFIETPSGGFGD